MAKGALLDTHALLWYSVTPEQLSATALEFIRNRHHSIYVSSTVVWEIAIKLRLGKLPQAQTLHDQLHGRLAQYGFLELPFTSVHALAAGALASDHRDPFDRALAAQAVSEQLPIITKDSRLATLPGVTALW